jgi:diguanylate cyclase
MIFIRRYVPIEERLTDDTLRELVDMMFTSLLPVSVMGFVATAVAALVALTNHDPAFPILMAGCLIVSLGRVGTILAYRRQPRGRQPVIAQVAHWEGRYALGSFAFATLLGLLIGRVLMMNDPVFAMLATGMAFGYGAGLVTRISVRPVICVVSLLLAVVPTVAGLATHFNDARFHASVAYMGQALLIASFALASFETVAHVYRTAVRHLLTQRDLAALVHQDPLTGLPNRLVLHDRLEVDVARMQQNGHLVALHALDLDRFKAVNDDYGHPMGDALLQAVAGRLRNTVPVGDMVARLGGDEFVVVQANIRDADEARTLARRIIRVVSAPYRFGEHDLKIGVSVGIALAPHDGLELKMLMARADAALYDAKRGGRSRVVCSGDLPQFAELPIAV